MGGLFMGFKPARTLLPAMTDVAISAPAGPFLAGLGKTLGYNVEADGERLAVAFEPWSLEHADPYEIPCLRLRLTANRAGPYLQWAPGQRASRHRAEHPTCR